MGRRGSEWSNVKRGPWEPASSITSHVNFMKGFSKTPQGTQIIHSFPSREISSPQGASKPGAVVIACGPSTWQKGPEFESHLGYMIPFLKTVMTKPGCVMDGRLVDLKCHLDEIQPLLAERPLDAPGGRVILGGLIKVGRSMLTMGETIPWDGNRGELRTSIHPSPSPHPAVVAM